MQLVPKKNENVHYLSHSSVSVVAVLILSTTPNFQKAHVSQNDWYFWYFSDLDYKQNPGIQWNVNYLNMSGLNPVRNSEYTYMHISCTVDQSTCLDD